MRDGALGVQIMEILWQQTDAEHTLSQKRIRELLKNEWGIEVKSKTLHRVLDELAAFCRGIRYTERYRCIGDTEAVLRTGFYLQHPFSEEELQHLLNCVSQSGALQPEEKGDLTEKICRLGSRYFEPEGISSDQRRRWLLEQAVAKQKRLCVRLQEADGSTAVHLLEPLSLRSADGRDYVCCRSTDGQVREFPLERLMDMQTADGGDKPQKKAGQAHELLPKNVVARFCVRRSAIPSIRAQFGEQVSFGSGTDGWAIARIWAPAKTLIRFAQLYGGLVVLLEPADLRHAVQKNLHSALSLYQKTAP